MTDSAHPYLPPQSGPTDAYDSMPPLTPAERVSNTFFAPSKTFADIRRNRSWWLPFLIACMFSYLFAFAALGHVGARRLAENSIRNSPAQNKSMQDAPPEQRAQRLKIAAISFQVSLLSSPLFVLLFAAVGALLLWVGFNFILGGSSTYGGMFAVMNFALLPGILRSLLSVVTIYAGDPDTFNMNDPVGTNPGFYMGSGSSPFLKSALGSLDLFSLWTLALMALGGAIVARVKPSTGFGMVFTVWLVIVLLKAAVTAAMS